MNQVKLTQYPLVLPTYREPSAEKLPMFAENRVHQRSTGNPYPNPVVVETDRVHREEKAYRCVCLENEYLRIELLPELGGRIYSALDKTTGYDFFYKQHVIKPALIGLLGSWVSGGVELNWPCHHRPSTFMPVDYTIEREESGAVTVWMSENEPMDRMKGMVGIRLAPGEARFETRMRVYNRTQTRRSFLWWENAAVPVNESYELFFPPDVHYVQFHYRKNVTSFPIAKGVYNGIRMDKGTDIRQHRNTLQPTSFFCAGSHYDFFGGYDHGKQAGVVHIGDHDVSIGKKMFTWAYNQLSASWEKALTDTDGMYAELMASSYSANQPDFAWLEPYEEKTFSQSWYPIAQIGAPVCATLEAALSVQEDGLMIQATREIENGLLTINGEAQRMTLEPGKPVKLSLRGAISCVTLHDAHGTALLRYCPQEERPEATPDPITDNPSLDQLSSAQECYLAGVHVAQYRDPAISADSYFREALRRDAQHAPAHQELARWLYDHLFYEEALEHAKAAWRITTQFNFHPLSGDIPYQIGLILEAIGQDDEAYDWHQKAAWAQDTRSSAMTRIAMIDGRRKNWQAMEGHAREALRSHAGNGTAAACLALALSHQGKAQAADGVLADRLAEDPLDGLCLALKNAFGNGCCVTELTDQWQRALDLAEDLEAMGETEFADALLKKAVRPAATAWPLRHGEYRRLSKDGTDDYGLACLLYAKGHYEKAAAIWETLPQDYRVLRNLAAAYYSHLGREKDALALMRRAVELAPDEQQLIWEMAYLMGRMHVPFEQRIEFLAARCTPTTREDILVEYARVLNQAGRHEKAIDVLLCRQFTPCEGGEHAVAEQYMLAKHALGRRLFALGEMEAALAYFREAQVLPDTLGAGLWNEVLLVPHRFYEAECLSALNQPEAAKAIYNDIVGLLIDYFSNMHLPELRCWQALCWMRLDQCGRAEMMLREHIALFKEAQNRRDAGFFKTTPFFISFVEPAKKLRAASCAWQMAVANWALGQPDKAKQLTQQALDGEPFTLYAYLLADELKKQ